MSNPMAANAPKGLTRQDTFLDKTVAFVQHRMDDMDIQDMEPNPEDQVKIQQPEDTPAPSKAPSAAVNFFSDDSRYFRFRIWYLCAVADFFISAIWFGRSPSTYYYPWSINTAAILVQRIFVFSRRRLLFFLLSPCYIITLTAVYYCAFKMPSLVFARTIFVVGMGSMTGTSFLMNNRLLFHEWNSISLLYIHWGLGVLAYTLRWHSPAPLAAAIAASAATQSAWEYPTMADFLLPMTLLYVYWAIGYAILIFIVFAKTIARNNYSNQYAKAVEGSMGLVSKMTNIAPPELRPVSYLIAQYIMYAFGNLIAIPMWYSQPLSAAWLIGILGVCTWRGSKIQIAGVKPKRA